MQKQSANIRSSLENRDYIFQEDLDLECHKDIEPYYWYVATYLGWFQVKAWHEQMFLRPLRSIVPLFCHFWSEPTKVGLSLRYHGHSASLRKNKCWFEKLGPTKWLTKVIIPMITSSIFFLAFGKINMIIHFCEIPRWVNCKISLVVSYLSTSRVGDRLKMDVSSERATLRRELHRNALYSKQEPSPDVLSFVSNISNKSKRLLKKKLMVKF